MKSFGGISIKLRPIPDLHLDFLPEGGNSFLERLSASNIDFLVLPQTFIIVFVLLKIWLLGYSLLETPLSKALNRILMKE